MKIRWVKYSLISIISISLMLFLAIKIFDVSAIFNSYLTVNKPIPKAEVLICEGWMREHHLKRVIEEFQNGDYRAILVTGINLSAHNPELYDRSDLIITNIQHTIPEKTNSFRIMLTGYTSPDADDPMVEVSKNNELLHIAHIKDRMPLLFESTWSESDSLVLSFTNGTEDPKELDKLVQVNYITVNGKWYPLQLKDLFMRNQGEIIEFSRYTVEAKLAGRLKTMGLKIPVFSIPTSKEGLSKTYNAAKEATNWMRKHSYESANVISVGTHTRRTYTCYQKVGKDVSVGMIAIPTFWRSSKGRIVKELTGIFTIRLVPRYFLEKKGQLASRMRSLVPKIRFKIQKLKKVRNK